jgi:hypothetical protein
LPSALLRFLHSSQKRLHKVVYTRDCPTHALDTDIFLAVIAGGEIAGLLGVIFAVPALAVLKVLFDFTRVRLQTED